MCVLCRLADAWLRGPEAIGSIAGITLLTKRQGEWLFAKDPIKAKISRQRGKSAMIPVYALIDLEAPPAVIHYGYEMVSGLNVSCRNSTL